MSENNNLKLWDEVCVTDPSVVRMNVKMGGGRTITSIDAQSQRKNATKIFGAYGIGWGVEIGSEEITTMLLGETTLATYRAILFYNYNGKLGRIPITADIKIAYVTKGGTGYLAIDDEWSKKVQTNAITKGLSTLGFNSDVFEKKFDDCKYVQAITQDFLYITDGQFKEIETLMAETKTDMAKFLEFMGVKSLGYIAQDDYMKAVSSLKTKKRGLK